jgi:TPR repeat protein
MSDKGNYELYYKYLDKAHKVNREDPHVLTLLGLWHLGDKTRSGMRKDSSSLAETYLTAAAKQGHTAAEISLGQINYLKQNNEEAIRLFKLAADKNNKNAQFVLGRIYFFGEIGEKDLNKGAALIKLSADQGIGDAQVFIGNCYESGEGMTHDIEAAVHYYQLALNNKNTLEAAKINLPKKIEHICKSFKKGFKEGVETYYQAKEKFKEHDNKGGIQDLEKAIELGSPKAMTHLATIYRVGTNEVDKNYKKAFELYEKAAKLGYPQAQFHLGHLYKKGVGVKKDLKQALHWFSESDDLGNIHAKKEIELWHEQGLAVYEEEGEKGDSKVAIELDKKTSQKTDYGITQEELGKHIAQIEKKLQNSKGESNKKSSSIKSFVTSPLQSAHNKTTSK